MNLTESQVVTGNTRHTQPENRAFFPALDGLRAVAFLMVFLEHYYLLPWGWTGVNVFFVLSGFLITGILFDTRDETHRARNFYVRRTLRIFPLYYGIVVLLVVLWPVFHWRWNGYWMAWPLYVGNCLRFVSPSALVAGSALQAAAKGWLYSQGHATALYFGHFWSLCIEEQFYLLWPWVVFGVRKRRALMWMCGGAVVLVPLLRVLTQARAPEWMLRGGGLLHGLAPFQMDSLLLGGLVALLWRGARRETLLTVGRVMAAVLMVAALVYVGRTLHVTAGHNWRSEYQYPAWTYTWGLTVVNLLAAAVLVCCLRSEGWMARMLCWRPLRWMGRISYGAYVFHDIPHGLYHSVAARLGAHSRMLAGHVYNVTMVVALGGTLALAWASFRWFESLFLEMKERWTVRG